MLIIVHGKHKKHGSEVEVEIRAIEHEFDLYL
jgi:hypothetical protein